MSKKVVLRIGATLATLLAADVVSKAVSTATQLGMNSVAVGQLDNSDIASAKSTMLQWLMQSGWASVVGAVVVVTILYFIWKGQFKNV